MLPTNVHVLVLVSTLFVGLTYANVVKGHNAAPAPLKNETTPTNTGICLVEVSNREILNVTDPNIPVPTGNGTKPGFSKIHVCCKGYKRHPRIYTRCEPVCESECVNANCTGPNTCTCFKGYVLDYGHQCSPTCPIGCLNGHCSVADGRCKCNTGYELDERGLICVPKCSLGCTNGNCTAPETCVCKPGFVKDRYGECKYHCDRDCGVGAECSGPNVCTCKPGYVLENNACRAECAGGCEHGICKGPNTCVCLPGYAKDVEGKHCVPHCTRPCLNGVCTAPDTCTCRKGYINDPTGANRCVAHCPRGCFNGVCSSPNFCICNPGFVKDMSIKGGNRCIPNE